MNFMGIGVTELIFVIVIAFIVLGPAKTMETIKDFARLMKKLRSSWDEIKKTVDESVTEVTNAAEFKFDMLDGISNLNVPEKTEDKSNNEK
ncbi:MAG TPA: hypothetical protein DEZ08_06430 [Dehalococcoidia bacterium]|mgnify:CR=1 FL=1|nr:hypothetical protein [Dehalococcoidia bacterium]